MPVNSLRHVVIILGVLVQACAADCELDSPIYEFSFHNEDAVFQIGSARWNTRIEPGPYSTDFAGVILKGADYVDGGVEPLEFFDGSGARADIPSSMIFGVSTGDSRNCTHDQLNYDLRGLPDGAYTVVHRLGSVPGFEPASYLERDVREHEGDAALVTTLVLEH